jgi:hypothetical protein
MTFTFSAHAIKQRTDNNQHPFLLHKPQRDLPLRETRAVHDVPRGSQPESCTEF